MPFSTRSKRNEPEALADCVCVFQVVVKIGCNRLAGVMNMWMSPQLASIQIARMQTTVSANSCRGSVVVNPADWTTRSGGHKSSS
jgi:hypothetical protein